MKVYYLGEDYGSVVEIAPDGTITIEAINAGSNKRPIDKMIIKNGEVVYISPSVSVEEV